MADSIDLCTRDDVRLALEIQAGKTGRDQLIDDAITDASQRIIDWTERELAPCGEAGVIRTFPVDWTQADSNGLIVNLTPYDLQAASSVILHPETTATVLVAGTSYTLEPVPTKWGVYNRVRLTAAALTTSTFLTSFGTARLQITGTWGFPEIPRAARRACIVTVTSWVDRKAGAYAPQDSDQGRMVLPDTAGGLDIPNSAKRMLEPFKRMVVV